MIHIDNATTTQLDYAAAVGQGWELRGVNNDYWHNGNDFIYGVDNSCIGDYYHPTTNKEQCSDLIDKCGISTRFNGMWDAYCGNAQERIGQNTNQFRLVAAVKAFLWSVYPDGIIPVIEDVKND